MISEAYCKKSGPHFSNTRGSRSDRPPSCAAAIVYPLECHKEICTWEIIGKSLKSYELILRCFRCFVSLQNKYKTLTVCCRACKIMNICPKFWFWNKKGPFKKIPMSAAFIRRSMARTYHRLSLKIKVNKSMQ